MNRARMFAAVLLVLLLPVRGEAQLSPGPLHRVHASLEGPQKCGRCHTPRRGVDPGKCLSCHTLLQARIQAGKGFHASPDVQRCERCHVEHQGRNSELIWWGERGKAGFDHGRTGYPLKGKHAEIQDCRKCHRAAHIVDPEPLKKAHKDLDRTFLGLHTACVSCHRDPHGGQFGKRACSTCHTERDWHTPERFRHDRTRFPLKGKHRSVACRKCHKKVQGRVQFAQVAFDRCDRCHTSPHKNDLGRPCRSCHTPRGWRIQRGAFDHDRTGFPLRGAHVQVACVSCHPAGRPVAQTPTECAGCHQDPHLGQFRPGRCDRCHDVRSFGVPLFTVKDHDTTRFPLNGAHGAVPCNRCHKPVSRDRFVGLTGMNAVSIPDTLQPVVFRWNDRRCTGCHTDPHEGEFAGRFAECTGCHTVTDWGEVNFDHNRDAKFSLRGAHKTVACAACHTSLQRTPRPRPLRLDGIPTRCSGCHADKGEEES